MQFISSVWAGSPLLPPPSLRATAVKRNQGDQKLRIGAREKPRKGVSEGEMERQTLFLISYTCDLKDNILPLPFKYNFIPGFMIDQ
jgi:hypothetical protein